MAASVLLVVSLPSQAAPRPALHACEADAHSRADCQQTREAIDDPERLAAARRKALGTRAQRECRSLRAAIRDNEDVAQRGALGLMDSLQQETLSLRQRYRDIGC